MRRVSFLLGAVCLLSGSGLYGPEAITYQEGQEVVESRTGRWVPHEGARRHFREKYRSGRTSMINQYQQKWKDGVSSFDSYFSALSNQDKQKVFRHALRKRDNIARYIETHSKRNNWLTAEEIQTCQQTARGMGRTKRRLKSAGSKMKGWASHKGQKLKARFKRGERHHGSENAVAIRNN